MISYTSGHCDGYPRSLLFLVEELVHLRRVGADIRPFLPSRLVGRLGSGFIVVRGIHRNCLPFSKLRNGGHNDGSIRAQASVCSKLFLRHLLALSSVSICAFRSLFTPSPPSCRHHIEPHGNSTPDLPSLLVYEYAHQPYVSYSSSSIFLTSTKFRGKLLTWLGRAASERRVLIVHCT